MNKTVTTPNGLKRNSSILSQSGRRAERVILPLPPEMTDMNAGTDTRLEMDIYARFMRHLRDVPNSRMDIKILSSIQFTADMTDTHPDMVAKTLVDLGLRAPRRAFPDDFLEFCDNWMARRSMTTINSEYATPPKSVVALHEFWGSVEEDRGLTAYPIHYAVFQDSVFVSR